MNIKLLVNNQEIPHKSFIFPGGEVGVKLNTNLLATERENKVTIVVRLKSSADIFEMAMVKDAVEKHLGRVPVNLFMPYVPYGRQDRVCDKGEAFSLKVFADYLNHLKFNKVTIVDPHSDVSAALIDNVKVINQLDVISKYIELVNVATNCILVSPDAGANKKTAALAHYLGKNSFVRADKLRDLSNGNILETVVYRDNFNGLDIVVADDLCDGGRTFTELAKVCKTKNCGKVILFVTHGIFSKGTKTLLGNGIDQIYTTDSLYNRETEVNDGVKVLKLEPLFI